MVIGTTGEMLREQIAGLVNSVHECVSEVFGFEMFTHPLDELFPKGVTTALVNPAVADHGELL